MAQRLPEISDHALLRWLERVHGIDTEFFRSCLAEQCAGLGTARAARIDGFQYIFRDNTLITVRPVKSDRRRTVSGLEARG